MAFKIPRPDWSQAVVDKAGKATRAFSRRLDEAFSKIEQQEAAQDGSIAAIQLLQEQQAQQLQLIIQALNSANIAIQLATDAQNSADGGGSATARSGKALATVNLNTTSWIDGPIVNLSTVTAGDLTISGSGFSSTQASSVSTTGVAEGEYRIIEDGTTDVGFLGTWMAPYDNEVGGEGRYVVDTSDPSSSSFVSTRTTSGSVSYRIQYRRNSGPALSVPGIVSVRRA